MYETHLQWIDWLLSMKNRMRILFLSEHVNSVYYSTIKWHVVACLDTNTHVNTRMYTYAIQELELCATIAHTAKEWLLPLRKRDLCVFVLVQRRRNVNVGVANIWMLDSSATTWNLLFCAMFDAADSGERTWLAKWQIEFCVAFQIVLGFGQNSIKQILFLFFDILLKNEIDWSQIHFFCFVCIRLMKRNNNIDEFYGGIFRWLKMSKMFGFFLLFDIIKGRVGGYFKMIFLGKYC